MKMQGVFGRPTGVLEITKISKTGEVVDRQVYHNLVVKGTLTQQIRALVNVGNNIANYRVANVQIGTSSVLPAFTDAAIITPINAPITSYFYLSATAIQFVATLAAGVSPGVPFCEAGLVMANNSLLTRVTFPIKTTDTVFGWQFTWTLDWTVAVNSTILYNAYARLMRIMAGDTAATAWADRMSFGTGTDAPDPASTVLQLPITPTKTLTTVTEVGDYDVQATAYLLAAEGNGFPIGEAGLVAGDGHLITRGIVTPTVKTSDYQFRMDFDLISVP